MNGGNMFHGDGPFAKAFGVRVPNQMRTSRMGQEAEVPKPERPDLPVRPEERVPKEPMKPEQGFHGKALLSYDEARELSILLEEVLAPLTPEQETSQDEEDVCKRDLHAGEYPIVIRLQERLKSFLAVGDTMANFEISQGELNVTSKSVECAVAIGKVRLTRTLVTAGGVAAGGAALLLLL